MFPDPFPPCSFPAERGVRVFISDELLDAAAEVCDRFIYMELP
jgi:hypothetical protein